MHMLHGYYFLGCSFRVWFLHPALGNWLLLHSLCYLERSISRALCLYIICLYSMYLLKGQDLQLVLALCTGTVIIIRVIGCCNWECHWGIVGEFSFLGSRFDSWSASANCRFVVFVFLVVQ